MDGTGVRRTVCAAAMAAVLAIPHSAGAETLEGALGQAYRNNPTLNAQRAALRATDESVPQALSNYRPRVQGSFDTGYQHFESISTSRRRLHADQHQHQPARRQHRTGPAALSTASAAAT